MTTVLTKADDEAQIRARIDEWAKAARAKDINGVMSHYAPHVVAFDAIAALQFKGAEAYRKHYEACFAMCSGPTTFEIHDLDITARDDVAFGHYLFHCGGTSRSTPVCHLRTCARKRGASFRRNSSAKYSRHTSRLISQA